LRTFSTSRRLVSEQLTGLAAGSSAPASDWRHRVTPREELGDVVAVAAGEGDRERDAAGVAIRWCLEPGRPRSTGEGPT
jgi:hypothetical protein